LKKTGKGGHGTKRGWRDRQFFEESLEQMRGCCQKKWERIGGGGRGRRV
jgi:hypothetical protein